ncbi:MAG: hypothetical protein LLG05_09805 [Porphyromonadaceae bacterium]|nr:hypothetical protein [Porphyromonadaceae bacterium]
MKKFALISILILLLISFCLAEPTHPLITVAAESDCTITILLPAPWSGGFGTCEDGNLKGYNVGIYVMGYQYNNMNFVVSGLSSGIPLNYYLHYEYKDGRDEWYLFPIGEPQKTYGIYME